MSLEAVHPDGSVEMLSHVDDFQFNWHINYVYADDVAPLLPPGTLVRVSAWHDNTAANRFNPDPNQWVGWGQRSYDEMYPRPRVVHRAGAGGLRRDGPRAGGRRAGGRPVAASGARGDARTAARPARTLLHWPAPC